MQPLRNYESHVICPHCQQSVLVEDADFWLKDGQELPWGMCPYCQWLRGACPRCQQLTKVRDGLIYTHSVKVDKVFRETFGWEYIPTCVGSSSIPLREIIKPAHQMNMVNVPMGRIWTVEFVVDYWKPVECVDDSKIEPLTVQPSDQPFPDLVLPGKISLAEYAKSRV
jgi:hypothetical protein